MIFGVIHGIIIESSLNLIISWILIGFWFDYVLKFFEKIKTYREYNSPHNTSFFFISVIFIGLFYLYTGYFTELFSVNLINEYEDYLYFSPWIIIFSYPFLIYGLYSIYSSIKKYEVIYLYKQRSVNARFLAIGFSLILLIFNILFSIIILFQNQILLFKPKYQYPDIFFILLSVILLILSIYGIIKKEPSISDLTPEMIASRRSQVRQMESEVTRRVQSRSPQSTRKKRSSQTIRPSQRVKKKTQTKVKPSTKRKPSKNEILKRIKEMKPKAGVLNIEDFKCVFCFELPQYPRDKGRGIILCPKCKHPAHTDEFKDWLRSSNLCSRCNAEIPYSFRKNPKVISVKSYTKVIEYYKKKENL